MRVQPAQRMQDHRQTEAAEQIRITEKVKKPLLVIGFGHEFGHLQKWEIDAFVGHPLAAKEVGQAKERGVDQQDKDAPLRQHRQPEGPGDALHGLQEGEVGLVGQAIVERFENGRIPRVETLRQQGLEGAAPGVGGVGELGRGGDVDEKGTHQTGKADTGDHDHEGPGGEQFHAVEQRVCGG